MIKCPQTVAGCAHYVQCRSGGSLGRCKRRCCRWSPHWCSARSPLVKANANSNGQAVISAKFNCGTASVDGDVVQGVYATSINIHNPQQQTTVQFSKTFVEAFEEGSGQSSKSSTTNDSLGPNQAEFVDCPVIYAALKVAPGTPIEGFVVIDILQSSYGNEFLDVVGKYTARSSGGQVSGLDIVVYTPSQINN